MITPPVLDTAKGRPAAGVPVRLELAEGAGWRALGDGVTDADGRLRTLTPVGPVTPGRYRLHFDTAAYDPDGFFPAVEIQFVVRDGDAHHHVPLLLAPFGYSTYRGS
jgi:5-hydroxyisourate hydrolase